MSKKYLQLFIAHNKGCQYYIGEYNKNKAQMPFIPEKHGRMSWKDISYFAPEALIDNNGRQIMWAWLRDDRYEGDTESVMHGWSGVFSLPRTLWLNDDGELGIAPVKELESLRYGETNRIENVTQNSCEINIKTAGKNLGKTGLIIKYSKNEYAEVYFDAKNQILVFDATNSADKYDTEKIERAPFALKENEPLNLTIYVDRSVIEIFANDRQAICRRVYADGKQNVKLILMNTSNAKIDLTAWNIMETNLY